MDIREFTDILAAEMRLLNAALDEANKILSKKFSVNRLKELTPIYVYSASLEWKIQQLKLTGEMEDSEQSFQQWRDRYQENP
jgi:hypothetical protein